MEENTALQPKLITPIVNIGIPNLYFNGFSIAVNVGDMSITLTNNGRPVLVLNSSHITAKTFQLELERNIKEFEKLADVSVNTIDELRDKIEKNNKNV